MTEGRKKESERLATLVRGFEGRSVVVLGDMVADQFLFGEISRVSREAPVLILRHELTKTVPGGGANCAMNLASLGARASVVGVVGDDEAGRLLLEGLNAAGVDCSGIAVAASGRTTTKVRVLAGQAHSPRQQVIRVDYEDEPSPASKLEDEINARLRERVESAEAVVVSDYNYGAANAGAIDYLREFAAKRHAPVLADSRFRLREFRGFTSATPNEDELQQICGVRLNQASVLEDACERLRAELDFRALLVTRGRHGMALAVEGEAALRLEAVGTHDAVDVTGAGDTVIATYALALASGAGYAEAARLSNHAGGIVVLKRGTACVGADELLTSLEDNC